AVVVIVVGCVHLAIAVDVGVLRVDDAIIVEVVIGMVGHTIAVGVGNRRRNTPAGAGTAVRIAVIQDAVAIVILVTSKVNAEEDEADIRRAIPVAILVDRIENAIAIDVALAQRAYVMLIGYPVIVGIEVFGVEEPITIKIGIACVRNAIAV